MDVNFLRCVPGSTSDGWQTERTKTKVYVKKIKTEHRIALPHTPRKFSTHADNLLRFRGDGDDRAGQALALDCVGMCVRACRTMRVTDLWHSTSFLRLLAF